MMNLLFSCIRCNKKVTSFHFIVGVYHKWETKSSMLKYIFVIKRKYIIPF